MNDNKPSNNAAKSVRRVPIVGRIGPGGVVTFDDPRMVERLRRGAEAAARRSRFHVVQD